MGAVSFSVIVVTSEKTEMTHTTDFTLHAGDEQLVTGRIQVTQTVQPQPIVATSLLMDPAL